MSDTQNKLQALKLALKKTAAERDRIGGTALAERQLIRDSGLLLLFLPKKYAGAEQNWIEILHSVREIASVDGSLAHLYAFQHLILATIQLFGSPEQAERFFQETAQGNLFWGNALNPLDNPNGCDRGRRSFVD